MLKFHVNIWWILHVNFKENVADMKSLFQCQIGIYDDIGKNLVSIVTMLSKHISIKNYKIKQGSASMKTD